MKKAFKLAFCLIIAIAVLSVPALAAEPGIGIIGGADGPTDILISPCPEVTEAPTASVPGEMSVLLNGRYVTFPDVVPQYKNDRTFIPFRAVCGAMGFDDSSIYFDDATGSACAVKDDVTISFPIGKNSVTVTKNGVSTVIDTDVASYIDHDRTLVPVRFFAEALGCKVTWDSYTNTIIIDDIEAILSANTETYDLMNQLIAYGQTQPDKNQSLTGTMTGSIKISDEVESVDAKLTGTVTGIASQTAMDMDMKLNVTGTYKSGDTLLPISAFGIPENPYLSMRYDLEGGTMAYKSNMMDDSYGMDLTDVWLLYDLNEMLAGEDLTSMVPDVSDYTFEELLAVMLESLEPYPSMTASDMLAMINSVCADSAFTKTGTTYTQTIPMDEYGKLELTIYTSLSRVTGYSVALNFEDREYDMMAMSLELTAKGTSATAKFTITSLDETVDASISFEISMSTSNTTKVPAGKPGEGEYVLDINDMYGGFLY